MLKKEEVFVRVSSKKKAWKLKELLDMFGEKVWSDTKERLEKGIVCDEYPFVHSGGIDWSGLSVGDTVKRKTKVSIKELRNILAVEHLKEGDVVITEHCGETIIAVYNKACTSSLALFEAKKWVRVSDGFLWDDKGCFNNFIRYATEEEKALLNPKQEKKELEVGKWYKYPDYPNFLSIHSTYGNRYGFDIDGLWFNAESKLSGSEYVEATPEEVKQALIKEAKRRYKVGDKIEYHEGVFSIDLDNFIYIVNSNILNCSFDNFNGSVLLFRNGQWAEIIKPQGEDNDLDRLSEIVNEAVTLINKLKNK